MAQQPDYKNVYSTDDFEVMGWHDCAVHAIGFEWERPYTGRLHLDIDYIFDWVPLSEDGGAFAFWLSPATLVFDDVSKLRGDLDLGMLALELSLDAIHREPAGNGRSDGWRLEGHEFGLSFNSTGFRQSIRRPPEITPGQRLGHDRRGGFSFSTDRE